MHSFRQRASGTGSNMISSLDVAVDLEITAIAKKISGTRRRRRAFRARKTALLFAEVAGLLEGITVWLTKISVVGFSLATFTGFLARAWVLRRRALKARLLNI